MEVVCCLISCNGKRKNFPALRAGKFRAGYLPGRATLHGVTDCAPPALPASGAPRKGRFPTGGTFHISPGVQRVSPVMGVSPRAENTRIISLYGATPAKERALSPMHLHPHGHHTLYPSRYVFSAPPEARP